jgi:hypothetical protein
MLHHTTAHQGGSNIAAATQQSRADRLTNLMTAGRNAHANCSPCLYMHQSSPATHIILTVNCLASAASYTDQCNRRGITLPAVCCVQAD